MLHLVGTVYRKVYGLLPGLQLLHRQIQLLHGGSDPGGEAQVYEHQQKDGKYHHKKEEQQQLAVIVPQVFRRHHTHQLPAGVAHGLYRHLPPPALKGLVMAAVGVGGGGTVVLLQQSRVNQLLPGVVNNLPRSVHNV